MLSASGFLKPVCPERRFQLSIASKRDQKIYRGSSPATHVPLFGAKSSC